MKAVAFVASLFFAMVGTLAIVPHSSQAQAQAQSEGQPKVIEISAQRFGFSPDNITLKKGEPVILRLTSHDVTHGFFVRALKVDELIEPGKTLDAKVQPDKEGTFTVICHHFCGQGHGNMKMTVTVVP
jgi:cytochrome c oxidase subunit II